jgi:phage shock protein PspC (stress-responsive transcriptional regulator)
MIAGVASGLGDYFSVDPVVFRVGFVLAAFLGGVGILVYGLLWWFTPASPARAAGSTLEPRSERLRRSLREAPVWVGVALAALGAIVIAGQLHVAGKGGVWGLALIALGVLLFRQGRGEQPAVDGLASDASATDTLPMVSPGEASLLPTGPAPRLEAAPSRPHPRRERSPLGWITIGAMLVAVGAAALLDGGGAVHFSAAQFLALPLAILGLGLLAGAWWGHARWLIVIGLLLVPPTLGASLIDVPVQGGFGDRFVRPLAFEDVQPAYRLVAGQMVLDLRGVVFDAQPLSVTATAVAGRILVLVPPDVSVQVHARTGAGEVSLFGQTYDGLRVDVERTFTSPISPASFAVLVLELEASFGQVEVDR